MSELFIPLHFTPGVKAVFLRDLCGADELSFEETDLKNLIALLDSLIQKKTESEEFSASQIVTADRDRILAAMYISVYGDLIESTVSCENCNQKFDLDFSLYELLNHYQPKPEFYSDRGNYDLMKGIKFRLPNGEDEMLIMGLDKEEAEKILLERCLLKGNPKIYKEKVQAKMEEIAPVLRIDMQAECPECNNKQQVKFDMQSFLMTKLEQDKKFLIREVHDIATQYHWSQKEILQLPRKIRKQYVSLIQSEY